jgi:hypothetical protein
MTTTKTIVQIINEWLDSVDVTDVSKRSYRVKLNLWFRWLNNIHYDVRRPTRQQVLDYKRHLEAEGKSSLTVDSCNSGYMDGYQLDKDILSNGNKHYSPDTCVFIPHDINSLFRETSRKIDLPRGVNKYNSRYVAEFRAKGIHKKKYFSSKEEASKWYLKQKQQYIITLANDYYSKKLIHKRAYDGMLKYALENLV